MESEREPSAEYRKAREALDTFDAVDLDFEGSSASFGYGGGRDFFRIVEEVRE